MLVRQMRSRSPKPSVQKWELSKEVTSMSLSLGTHLPLSCLPGCSLHEVRWPPQKHSLGKRRVLQSLTRLLELLPTPLGHLLLGRLVAANQPLSLPREQTPGPRHLRPSSSHPLAVRKSTLEFLSPWSWLLAVLCPRTLHRSLPICLLIPISLLPVM